MTMDKELRNQTEGRSGDQDTDAAQKDSRNPFEAPRLENKGELEIQAGSLNLWQTGP